MLRSPSLPLHEYDDMSSPDPLANSFNDENNESPMRSKSPVRRSTSPSKYTTILQDVELSTPRRNGRGSTNQAPSPSRTVSEQILSPWKIRVTVEAEPENMIGSTKTITRTMKVPLREASSPLQNSRIDWRGGNSLGGTLKSRRSGTPTRGRSNSRGRRQSVTDLDIVVLGDDGESDDWTKQKSPSKRKPRQSQQKKKEVTLVEDVEGITQESSPRIDNRPRRKKVEGTRSFEIRQDTDEEDPAAEETVQRSISPELRRLDPNRVSMRSRSMSTRQKPLPPKDDTIETLLSAPAAPVRMEGTRHVSHTSADSYPTPTPSVQSEDEASKNGELEGMEVQEGFDTILESEGFTMIDLESVPSARQFLSSPPVVQGVGQEQASDSQGGQGNTEDHSPTEVSQQTPTTRTIPMQQPKTRPTPIPSYLMLAEGESDISSNVPSSPLVELASIVPPVKPSQNSSIRQVTPQTYSSPKLPSPPKLLSPPSLPIDKKDRKTATPTLARVVKAGIALQGVLSPKPTLSKTGLLSPYRSSSTPRERLDDLFEGFDSGTRRELRAGLRLGEELAKRQRLSPGVQRRIQSDQPSAPQPSVKSRLLLQSEPPIQIWRGETVVQRTPIPTAQLQEKVHESHVATILVDPTSERKTQPSVIPMSGGASEQQTPSSSLSHTPTPSILDTIQARREREWQLEREAVSREIENASSSRVIIIDSDDEEEHRNSAPESSVSSAQIESSRLSKSPRPITLSEAEQDEGDIWLEEAEACNSSSSNIQSAESELFTLEQQQKQQARAKEVLSRPRRNLIPSPWKRGGDMEEANSLLSNGDMTGLYFQQPKKPIKFGAGVIARQKRQTSSTSVMNSSQREEDTSQVSSKSEIFQQSKDEEGSEQSSQDRSEDEETEAEQAMLDAQLDEEVIVSTGDDLSVRTQEEIEDVNDDAESSFEEGSEIGNNTDVSSLPAQAIKVPVNFNDSTLSYRSSHPAPPLTRSSPSEALDSSRPSTPRSAIKGSRLSLGHQRSDSPSVRRVVFSERSLVMDVNGVEDTETLRSASSILPVRFEAEKEVVLMPEPKNEDSMAELESKEVEQKYGWFSWVWGKQKTVPLLVPGTDGTSEEKWEPAKTSLPSTSISTSASTSKSQPRAPKIPSYLRPPSYPSDPRRDPAVPLATSGEFTNEHFRTLNIIYAKSLRPRFHAPTIQEVREELWKLQGQKFSVDESKAGMGMFEWVVGEREVRVVERFMREVEFGYADTGKGEVRWGWSEREIVWWLFRIVVGEIVRSEEKGLGG